ncbi:ABC transporter permease [Mycoplana rhizolycopersici]|jgi:putative spermidine/putrescine transport system permease protein|uniref:ABC transporter permease n=1 Tax=Mycoplana rhizolycopersici TaxID=2746702 RepID=A0ABX2QP08_9HYPH|nr:ABC transporter permease [Rhizobium rhizolycopersici]NVP58624.1 ABC transporter permease [Rhizobium rhizolycopersici]
MSHAAAKTASPAGRTRDPFLLLAVPSLLLLGMLFALPIAFLLLKSFRDADGALSVAGYIAFFSDPYMLTALRRTIVIAFETTLLTLVLGYPTAFALARARGFVQTCILIAMILPLSVGVIVKAFAWSIVFRSDGVINKTLLGLGIIDEPLRLLFTETALVIGAANIFLPFMVLPIYAVIRQINPNLGPAAATLGAGPFFRFFRVTLPLTLPGVVAGAAFVFSMAVSMYVIPNLIVGERSQMLSMLIARSFLYLRDEQMGSTMSAVLLVIAAMIVIASSIILKRLSGRQA